MASTMTEYRKRMNRIVGHLGDKCSECGSTSDIHIDHIDHMDKSFTIASNWSLSWERLVVELSKCQLLCKKCHLDKSKKEGSLAKGWTNQSRQRHGTVWSYSKYKCRCDLCKEAKKTGRSVVG